MTFLGGVRQLPPRTLADSHVHLCAVVESPSRLRPLREHAALLLQARVLLRHLAEPAMRLADPGARLLEREPDELRHLALDGRWAVDHHGGRGLAAEAVVRG